MVTNRKKGCIFYSLIIIIFFSLIRIGIIIYLKSDYQRRNISSKILGFELSKKTSNFFFDSCYYCPDCAAQTYFMKFYSSEDEFNIMKDSLQLVKFNDSIFGINEFYFSDLMKDFKEGEML